MSATMESDVGSSNGGGEMPGGPLERTTSQHSTISSKSMRSATIRQRPKRHFSCVSSSASSISDKSLTSFPSFSPESPRDREGRAPSSRKSPTSTATATSSKLPQTHGTPHMARKPSEPSLIVNTLIRTPSIAETSRPGLFEDAAPIMHVHVPGSLHLANDDHVDRLIARVGAVKLVRQLAEDLAQKDVQIATARRKAEERERALRKIILQCGLSSLDLEQRLRVVERDQASSEAHKDEGPPKRRARGDTGLEDLLDDAMSESVTLIDPDLDHEATIRVSHASSQTMNGNKSWKDFLWGATTKKDSRASSISGIAREHRAESKSTDGRPSVLQPDLFHAPNDADSHSASRASSVISQEQPARRPSGLAALALKLVAGNVPSGEGSTRHSRANSAGTHSTARTSPPSDIKPLSAAVKSSNLKQTPRAMVSGNQGASKPIPSRRRASPQGRWDTMGTSPHGTAPSNLDNFGPVEMDSIQPLEVQPPALQAYQRHSQGLLTDRFGFIYDQRRKRRQREAADAIKSTKRGSKLEMLNGPRDDRTASDGESILEHRPDTPQSIEDKGEGDKTTKKWQDYLKVATFPTELLSHTPSGGEGAFEVMEGGEVPMPKSPGMDLEGRGFVPQPSSAAVAQPALPLTSDPATLSSPDTTKPSSGALTAEDTEPVKLLLEQLGEVHDSFQREKTVRWNEFLRKVRAERRRDGVTAAAKSAASRDGRKIATMPEASLADGEVIGVAGLGNKGKVGRAKWNEFRGLVLGGIPVAYRAKIWAECSGAIALRVPGYYEDLVSRLSEADDPIVVAQINMDIHRTLTDNVFFRHGPGVPKLTEVLLAYSRRNSEVGYCQGMNLIAANLLLIMPTSEDAFWVLTSIIERTLPEGYYDRSLAASRADQVVLREYVGAILPQLSAHLDALSIELEALTFQWFLSVFTDCLSAEALFRVWDVVLCMNDGSTFLFQVALALLKLNEDRLLACATPASVYMYINHQMTNHAISIDGLVQASEGLRRAVRREDVEARRARALEREEEARKRREERIMLRQAERLLKEVGANVVASVGADTNGAEQAVGQKDVVDQHQQQGQKDEGDEVVVDDGLTLRTPMPMTEEEVGLGSAR